MQNLANDFGSNGIEYEITYQNGIATMRTVDTTGNVTIDVWEITVSRKSSSVFASPVVKANVSDNDWHVLAYMYVKEIIDPTEAVKQLNNTTPKPTTAYTVPDIITPSATQRLFSKTMTANDSDAFFQDEYSLRHTTNASNRGYYNVANINVNCIYTQAQFYSEITNGNYWIFPAPVEILGDLSSIFNSLGTAPANFINGALKGGSSRVTTANNRVNIITEYLIATIDTDNYLLAV